MLVHPGLGALPGQQVGVAAAGGQPDDLEAVRVGGDDLQRLGADGTGAAQDQHPERLAGLTVLIVPRAAITADVARVPLTRGL